MQDLTLANECYTMKLDLLFSAIVADKGAIFVENHKTEVPDNTSQNMEIVIDDTTRL